MQVCIIHRGSKINLFLLNNFLVINTIIINAFHYLKYLNKAPGQPHLSGVLFSDELLFFNPDVSMCCQANAPFR